MSVVCSECVHLCTVDIWHGFPTAAVGFGFCAVQGNPLVDPISSLFLHFLAPLDLFASDANEEVACHSQD